MKFRKLVILSFFFTFKVFAAQIDLSGIYQGKNLYIQNPLNIQSKQHCVEEVYLNDVKILSKVESSAFEIDLSHFQINESVNIKIIHHEGCTPKILNPQVIKSSVAFNFTNVKVLENDMSWGSKGENALSKYVIEHNINGTWSQEGELKAEGKGLINQYNLPLLHHSGINKYRIKYTEQDGVIYYSQVVEYKSSLAPLEFFPKRITDKINFSRITNYEIVDSDGVVLLKGKDKEVNMNDLPEGVYFLNSDNRSFKIYKK